MQHADNLLENSCSAAICSYMCFLHLSDSCTAGSCIHTYADITYCLWPSVLFYVNFTAHMPVCST
jgi:hypothetical protein